MNTNSDDARGRRRWPQVSAGVAFGLVALARPMVAAEAAAPPEPTYGTAVVDGAVGEWGAGDVFGDLVSNDPPYEVKGSVSLRYDCDTSVLYASVTAVSGSVFQTIDPAESYIRLGVGKLVSGLSGDDGVAPDFAWVGLDGEQAAGWEASAPVEEGSYPASLRIHTKVPDDSADGYEVLDLTPRYSDLDPVCPEVAPVTVTSIPVTVTSIPVTVTTTQVTTAPAVVSTTETAPRQEIVEAPAAQAVTVEGDPALTG